MLLWRVNNILFSIYSCLLCTQLFKIYTRISRFSSNAIKSWLIACCSSLSGSSIFLASFRCFIYSHVIYISVFIVITDSLLSFPSKAGNEVVTMWDHYAAGGTVLTCLIIHLIGWLWVYGKIITNIFLECR